MKNLQKKTLSLDRVYRLLEPGPVVLVSTQDKDKMNAMAMSWHMMVDFVPPLIACVISNRNFSFHILKKTKQCVINIPSAEIAKKVVAIGNTTGRTVDKFKEFDILHEKASKVNAPLLTECFANFECEVIDMKMTEKYNIFILEVKKAWIRPHKHPKMIHHAGKGNFIIDGKLIRLPSKMK